MRTLIVLCAVGWTACAPTRSEPGNRAQAQARRRRTCASEGFSCVPGPCCHGLRCVDDVCRKPAKTEK